jgi:hypothetical protein
MAAAPKFASNYKPPNVKDIKGAKKDEPKKKMGWW